MLAAVRERLADDLDTPGAIAAVDAWAGGEPGRGGVRQCRPGGQATDDWDEQSPAVVRDLVDALLGIALTA